MWVRVCFELYSCMCTNTGTRIDICVPLQVSTCGFSLRRGKEGGQCCAVAGSRGMYTLILNR